MREGKRQVGRERRAWTYKWKAQEVEERQGREAVAAAESAAQGEGVEEEGAESHQGWGRVLSRLSMGKGGREGGREGGK